MSKLRLVTVSEDELEILIKESMAAGQRHVLEEQGKLIRELSEKLAVVKEWLTLHETAKMLNDVTPETVRRFYIPQGLAYSKRGNNLFFHIDDIKAFIEEGRVKKAS